MRKTSHLLLTLLLLLTAGSATLAQASLLISELCDPRLNYLSDRFIEIYNSGDQPVDLSGWNLVAVGNTNDIFTWNLSGSINPGQALVAGDATTVVDFQVDFAAEAWSDNNSTWNGKVGDGARLVNPSSAPVDVIVADGTRFENQDYVRNADVLEPSTVFVPAQWTGTAVDYPDEGTPGAHTVDGPVDAPEIGTVYHTPHTPAFGEDVHVFAVVTDDQATITSVVVNWGLASTSLDHQIAMTPTGDLFMTDTPIPAQAEGAEVFYQIEATNDVPASATSSLLSFMVPATLTIAEIQGEASASPYDGDTVVTEGVVTATYAAMYTIQDGAGPWSGLWVQGSTMPAVGDFVRLNGTVTESLTTGFAGTTVLADAAILIGVPGSPVPAAEVVTTGTADSEGWEGVLLMVDDAACSNAELSTGGWLVNDGSGALQVGTLGPDAEPTLGTVYDVTGPLVTIDAADRLEPGTAADVVWVSDDFAPVIDTIDAVDVASVLVTFSEDVDPSTATVMANYTIEGLSVLDVAQVAADQVDITTSTMGTADYWLTIDGVEDLFGNPTAGAAATFSFYDFEEPAGYYNGTEDLQGDDLRLALHNIIDNHNVRSYTFAWTAFYTTDDRPDGYVWDMYSDIPGGTPPYLYVFGDDQGGTGGVEGTGYNREHSWPRSWFGGEVSPMNSDLFMLYPTDNYVNNRRDSFPFGEIDNPEWTSLNGTKRGPCSYPGYSGTVFEPIDAYKGDFARTYFYTSTRYHTEDGSWPGSAMTDGADLRPWALAMLLEWHAADPVSLKELERNEAVYGFQDNRNPFIDHPEWAVLVFDPPTAVDDLPEAAAQLHQNAPNPFNPMTEIAWSLAAEGPVSLTVFDASGRLVRELVHGQANGAGRHVSTWNGTDQGGRQVAAGVYFYRLTTADGMATRKMTLVR